MKYLDLRNKLIKNSTLTYTSVISKSKIFGQGDVTSTSIPAINTALSGSIFGGLSAGILQIAGPSKHFKSSLGLLLIKAYFDAHPNAILLFYDNEFGTKRSYINSFDIDEERIVHSPITDVEQLKHDIVVQLDGLEREDEVFIFIDSIGSLASKKEASDALSGKEAADMTRAKQIKSLSRIITPHLAIKDIPCVIINHTYQTQETYSKTVVSSGTGIYYSSNDIWVIGRQQDRDKDTKEVYGYDFVINVEKSRSVQEKSKIPLSVSYERGIEKYSGLLDLAIEGNYVTKVSKGKHGMFLQRVDATTGELLGEPVKQSTNEFSKAFWEPILTETKFPIWIENKYKLPSVNMVQEEKEKK